MGKSMLEISRDHASSNQLLDSLSPSDQARLRPHLTAVNLKLRHQLESPNKPIENIYFMHTGFASVVAVQTGSEEIEIGLIGREGMTGSAVLLGNGQSPHSTYIQAVGTGEIIATRELRKATQESATLHRMLLKFVQAFTVQTAHTAIANARAKVSERLARWILMAQDRLGGTTLPLTHEFLALMLGVRRPGVTEALIDLRRRKLIDAKRGEVVVLNRKGLERLAGNFYGLPEQEYRRLLGN
jgi:CRP-like cAMP-binding protein